MIPGSNGRVNDDRANRQQGEACLGVVLLSMLGLLGMGLLMYAVLWGAGWLATWALQ